MPGDSKIRNWSDFSLYAIVEVFFCYFQTVYNWLNLHADKVSAVLGSEERRELLWCRDLDPFVRARLDRYMWQIVLASDAAGFAAATGQLIDPAYSEHLRTVLSGSHVPNGFARRGDGGALRAQMAVSINLYLGAAIRKDAFGDDSDGIYTFVLAAHDERGGFVVRVSRS